jgi:hypothetical protein
VGLMRAVAMWPRMCCASTTAPMARTFFFCTLGGSQQCHPPLVLQPCHPVATNTSRSTFSATSTQVLLLSHHLCGAGLPVCNCAFWVPGTINVLGSCQPRTPGCYVLRNILLSVPAFTGNAGGGRPACQVWSAGAVSTQLAGVCRMHPRAVRAADD